MTALPLRARRRSVGRQANRPVLAEQVSAEQARQAATPPWQRHVPGELVHQVTLGRDREPVHQLVGHPDRRTGRLVRGPWTARRGTAPVSRLRTSKG